MFGPDVFANGDADFLAAKIERRDFARRFEVTIFIEDIVGRQKRLVRFLNRFAAFKKRSGVMKRFSGALVSIDKTDEQRRAAQARLQLVEHLEILRNETRFENEILRRITGHGQFGREDDVGAGAASRS